MFLGSELVDKKTCIQADMNVAVVSSWCITSTENNILCVVYTVFMSIVTNKSSLRQYHVNTELKKCI